MTTPSNDDEIGARVRCSCDDRAPRVGFCTHTDLEAYAGNRCHPRQLGAAHGDLLLAPLRYDGGFRQQLRIAYDWDDGAQWLSSAKCERNGQAL